MIYADNAATTKLNREAFEAMTPFYLIIMQTLLNPTVLQEKLKKH